MLSPGTDHLAVPRGLTANLKFRRGLLDAVNAKVEESSRGRRERQRKRNSIYAACRNDFFFYLDAFVWTYDPRLLEHKVRPWVTWDFQLDAGRAILRAIEEQADLVIEKSRDMGASWLVLLAFEWLWHFHPDYKFLLVSRDIESVDKKGDMDSLFVKLDHVHRNLPEWLMPDGWEPKLHRTKMLMQNPETGSVISGEASTGKAGVGGRATAALLDEFSQVREDYEMLGRTASTTDCRIINGTHKGVGTAFYDILHGKLHESMRPRVLRMHWSQHPEKKKGMYHYDAEKAKITPLDPTFAYDPKFNFVMDGTPSGGPYPGRRSPWYDKKAPTLGSARQVAMDLDIDPQGSKAQYYDALTINTLIREYTLDPIWEGELHYDQGRATPTELVKRLGGYLRFWFHPINDRAVPPARYVIAVDNATGSGATPSCFTIANIETGEKVGEYASPKIYPDELGHLVVALGRLFLDRENTPAKLVWEANGPGLIFGKTIGELGYGNVYYKVDVFDDAAVQSEKPGWYPGVKQIRILHDDYRAALAGRGFINRSEIALRECLNYQYNAGGEPEHAKMKSPDDPSGARVNHGDRVIADALAWMLCKTEFHARVVEEVNEIPYGSLAWRRQKRQDAARELEYSEW